MLVVSLFASPLPSQFSLLPRKHTREARAFVGPPMAFISFVGRVLFVSAFMLSAWQEYNEFGADGGLAAKTFKPKFDVFSQQVSSQTGFQLPEVEIKYIVAAAVALKGLGSLLFIFGSSFGAFLLILHQAIVTPILYDFYNYDADKKQFTQLFAKFAQNMQLLGALLFFIGLNRSVIRRQVKKKSTKTKTMRKMHFAPVNGRSVVKDTEEEDDEELVDTVLFDEALGKLRNFTMDLKAENALFEEALANLFNVAKELKAENKELKRQVHDLLHGHQYIKAEIKNIKNAHAQLLNRSAT